MDVFRDRIAIVTGGASGIGRALGAALGQQGAVVVLADINRDGVETAARELTAGGRVGAAALDVTDADAVARLVTDTAAVHGRLDYLFNNAGIALMGRRPPHECRPIGHSSSTSTSAASCTASPPPIR